MVGIIVTLLVALVLLGGIKRIGSVSEKLVPFMALFYIVRPQPMMVEKAKQHSATAVKMEAQPP